MNKVVYCLDSSVLVKVLVPEEGSDEATALLEKIIATGSKLTAPAFAWAEVGTVLRKKVRAGLMSPTEADDSWDRFMALNVNYVEDKDVPRSAWKAAVRFGLPTLYDAAFLAVSEAAAENYGARVEFWTADRDLVKGLGSACPEYVRELRGPKLGTPAQPVHSLDPESCRS